jgi:hypothetical protein
MFDGSSYTLTAPDLDLIGALPDARVDGASLAERLLTAYRDQLTAAVLDRAAIEATDLARGAIPSHTVPHFDRDLHSLADIAAFAAKLNNGLQTTTATEPT